MSHQLDYGSHTWYVDIDGDVMIDMPNMPNLCLTPNDISDMVREMGQVQPNQPKIVGGK